MSSLRLLLPTLALITWGCQTYDFEPVMPTTIGQSSVGVTISPTGLKPNLMFMLDRSGSMNLPFNPSDPDCGTCGQPSQPLCNPLNCSSRWNTLQSTASSFLSENGTIARMGVAFFPKLTGTSIIDPVSSNPSLSCSATSEIDVPLATSDDAAALEASAEAVSDAIARVGATPSPINGGLGGGTPTGPSLSYVSQHTTFSPSGRQNFLLLMTDGLPNCSATSGLNNNANPTACGCTESALACSTFPALACNSYSETAQTIAQLHTAGIKTIVVGFGDVFGPSAQNSLQTMAVSGGFQRKCQANGQECNPNDLSCFQPSNTHLCAEQFFRVTSQDQLSAALSAISAVLVSGNPCVVTLEPAPENPSFIAVDVTQNGVKTSYPYPSDIWSFAKVPNTQTAVLTFNEPLCSIMQGATEEVTYVVRAVTLL